MMVHRIAFLGTALMLAPCAWAQTPEPAPAKPVTAQAPARISTTTVMVEVTVNRYRGDKRVSSVPFTLAVVPEGPRSTLRVGGQVPIPTQTFTPGAAKDGDTPARPANALMSYSYRDIGTNIDVTANLVGDGLYRVAITLEESSVYPATDSKAVNTVQGVPSFRSIRTNNSVILRDGQVMEFTAATDRIDGEVARISVKLTVPK